MVSKLVASLMAVASAMAFPASLQPRSCSTLYQPQLWTISQHEPEASNGPFTTPFSVFQDIGKKDLVASFRYIPGNAYGCTLQFDYQPGHNPLVVDSAGDTTLIDVYQISDGGNFPWPLTWDNTNARTSTNVGSFVFPSGSNLNTPQTIIINSMVCSPVMTFRFTIQDSGANGGVQVDEDSLSGLRIAYNC